MKPAQAYLPSSCTEESIMSNAISALNDLVETSKDGEMGFSKAAEQTKSPDLKSLLQSCSSDCAQSASDLRAAVAELGGKPEDGGTVTGALHRGWMNVKAAVSNPSDHDLLAECERGEDAAKKRFSDALEKTDLPENVRVIINRHYQGVLHNHDRIKALRDSLPK
jgi:uncharacterized protein (TIGR02284 family)